MKLTVSALVSHLNRVVLLRSIFVCFAFLKSFKISEELAWAEQSRSVSQQDGDKPTRNFLDDPRRSGPAPDTDRKEGSRRHVRNWGGLDFDNVKTGSELEKEWTVSTSLKMGFGWFCLWALPLSLFKLLWLNYLLSAEPETWSQRLYGYDDVYDRPGKSRVPALEEGAWADRWGEISTPS